MIAALELPRQVPVYCVNSDDGDDDYGDWVDLPKQRETLAVAVW